MTSLLHDNYIINHLDHPIEFYHILHSALCVEVFFQFLDNKNNFKTDQFLTNIMPLSQKCTIIIIL